MIVAMVTFDLPQPTSLAAISEVFASTAPKYLGLAGLVRKNYWVSEDGRRAGGLYVWRSKPVAEAFFDAAWRTMVRGKYGAEPQIVYLDSPVMVDNDAGRIVRD